MSEFEEVMVEVFGEDCDFSEDFDGLYLRNKTQDCLRLYEAIKRKTEKSAIPEGWLVDIKLDGMKIETPFGPGFIPHKMNRIGDLFISFCRALKGENNDWSN